MKINKIKKIMLMAFMLFTASLFITSVEAEAKAYKAKTVTVTSGKTKTVKTKKKIKKVRIVSKNKNFTVTKKSDYKFKVSGTDAGKTQTVKVTYTNKYTQKFKLNTKKAKTKTKKMPSYAQKIVNELKPLLANPDKGLQTAMTWWKQPTNDKYENVFTVINFNNNKTISILSMDDVMKTYTASQKKALILELYFRTRMTYAMANKGDYTSHRNSNAQFKKLLNGTFRGVCADGAKMGYDICQYLGIKSKYTGSMELDHGWCTIYVTDKNGVSYWHGVYTTAHSYNLKGTASVPNGWTMTKAQVNKYLCQPNNQTQIVVLAKRKDSVSRPVTPTAPSVTTQALVQTPVPTTPAPQPQRILIPHVEHSYTCPGCMKPMRHTSNTNPYITNVKATYKDYVVYQHVNNSKVRWFDADGNEYIDINNDGNIMDELITLAG